MANPKGPPKSYHQRRVQASVRKIREALDRLVRGHPAHKGLQDKRYKINVATVAEEAGVSRSTVYQNPDLVAEIKRRASSEPRSDRRRSSEDKIEEQRQEIEHLTAEKRRLATKNATLVQRARSAEKEAARQKKRADKLDEEKQDLTRQLSKLRQPTAIHGGTE